MKNFDSFEHGYGDLAMERMRADSSLPGVDYREEERGIARLTCLTVSKKVGEASLGFPAGRYLSVSFPALWTLDEGELPALALLLSEQLLSLCRARPKRVLAVGLGNRDMTADAVGPETIEQILATRHLKETEPRLFGELADTELSLLCPGVMGKTGMESGELIGAVAHTVGAELVLLIDALAARSPERLGATVQLSDSGLSPGAGVGNRRRRVDEAALGIPVLTLGIPTVIDSAVLLRDTLNEAGIEPCGTVEKKIKEKRGFFVCPKEADEVTKKAAVLLSDAVNLSFNRRLFSRFVEKSM